MQRSTDVDRMQQFGMPLADDGLLDAMFYAMFRAARTLWDTLSELTR
ncbi:hypothetical protein [Streptomyces sp. NPDC047043]